MKDILAPLKLVDLFINRKLLLRIWPKVYNLFLLRFCNSFIWNFDLISFFLYLPGDSFVLDVIPDPTEEISVSYTLKNTLLPNRLVEEQRHASDNYTGSEKKVELYNDSLQERAPNIIADQSIFFFFLWC